MCSLIRRKSIKEGWYFDCECRRCSDNTELGTHCNTLICNICGEGKLLVVSPLEYDSIWKCDNCGHEETMETVFDTVERFNNEVKSLYETNRYNQKFYIKEANFACDFITCTVDRKQPTTFMMEVD